MLDLIGHQALGALHLGVVETPAHEALDGIDGVGWVGDCLTLGQLPDQAFAGLGESHDRRHGPAALGRGDDDGFATLHNRHHRVGSPQIDTYNLAHVVLLAFSFQLVDYQ